MEKKLCRQITTKKSQQKFKMIQKISCISVKIYFKKHFFFHNHLEQLQNNLEVMNKEGESTKVTKL